MPFLEKLMQTEDIEIYFFLLLALFTLWFIRNTINHYHAEKRKIKNLHRFAKEGEREAQHDLATCYHQGYFVKKNCERAAFWYHNAALKGDETAKGHLEKFLQNHQKKKC